MHGRISVRILLGIAVVGVVAAVGAYFLFFTDDSPAPLTLSDTPATTAGGASGTAASNSQVAGIWTVASGSEAGYRVREKLANLPAQSDAVGRTSAVTGQVRIEPAGQGVVASDARFEVDLTKLTSGESRRDNRIRTQGLESNTFPTATFTSTEPIRLSQQPPAGQTVKVSAVGDLTLHGVTKRVTIPMDARLAADQIELVGSLSFPMSDFSIEPPSIGGVVTVEPDATMEFRLLLQKG